MFSFIDIGMSILEVAGFICKFGGGLNLKSKLK